MKHDGNYSETSVFFDFVPWDRVLFGAKDELVKPTNFFRSSPIGLGMFVVLAIEIKVLGSCPCLNRAHQVNINLENAERWRTRFVYIFPPLSIEDFKLGLVLVLSREFSQNCWEWGRPMLVEIDSLDPWNYDSSATRIESQRPPTESQRPCLMKGYRVRILIF